MTELHLQVSIRKDAAGVQTSFQLLNEGEVEAFGPWRGLPEAIQALVHCALLLEGRMQIMRLLEESRRVVPEDLHQQVLGMIQTQALTLLPKAMERCLSELERIQVP